MKRKYIFFTRELTTTPYIGYTCKQKSAEKTMDV